MFRRANIGLYSSVRNAIVYKGRIYVIYKKGSSDYNIYTSVYDTKGNLLDDTDRGLFLEVSPSIGGVNTFNTLKVEGNKIYCIGRSYASTSPTVIRSRIYLLIWDLVTNVITADFITPDMGVDQRVSSSTISRNTFDIYNGRLYFPMYYASSGGVHNVYLGSVGLDFTNQSLFEIGTITSAHTAPFWVKIDQGNIYLATRTTESGLINIKIIVYKVIDEDNITFVVYELPNELRKVPNDFQTKNGNFYFTAYEYDYDNFYIGVCSGFGEDIHWDNFCTLDGTLLVGDKVCVSEFIELEGIYIWEANLDLSSKKVQLLVDFSDSKVEDIEYIYPTDLFTDGNYVYAYSQSVFDSDWNDLEDVVFSSLEKKSFFKIPRKTTHQRTVPDGYIGVYTAEDLDNVRNDTTANYIQMANIDLSGYASWVPIGDSQQLFLGHYDGNNFTISNLTVVDKMFFGGLFANPRGAISIKNVRLSNVNISSGGSAGGIAGEAYGWSGAIPLIENCHVLSGQIMGVVVGGYNGDHIGGIVGYTSYANVEKCSSNCTISGRQHIGGIVGTHYGGDVEECFSLSSVTATFWNAGGLIAQFADGNIRNCYARGTVHSANRAGGLLGGDGADELCTIENCYFAGTVSADAGLIGGFAGYSSETSIRSNCYYDSDTTGLSGNNYGAEPKTTLEMKTKSTYVDWDFTTIWRKKVDQYPDFRPDIDINIGFKVPKFVLVREKTVPAGYTGVYTAEDLDNVRNNLSGKYIQMADIDLSDYNWIPLGNDSWFDGDYNGNYYKITGLSAPLFAWVESSHICNLTVMGDMTVSGNYHALLARSTWETLIENCVAIGSITTTHNNPLFVGLLIGSMDNETIVRKSYTQGTIDFSGNSDSIPVACGGFVGYISIGTNSSLLIEDCYSMVDLINYINYDKEIGGFAGWVHVLGSGNCQFVNCYSVGTLVGTSVKQGGFVGTNSSATFTSCYYDSEVSGQSDTGKGEPRTTTEMKTKSTYENWNFDTIWQINTNQYPDFISKTMNKILGTLTLGAGVDGVGSSGGRTSPKPSIPVAPLESHSLTLNLPFDMLVTEGYVSEYFLGGTINLTLPDIFTTSFNYELQELFNMSLTLVTPVTPSISHSHVFFEITIHESSTNIIPSMFSSSHTHILINK